NIVSKNFPMPSCDPVSAPPPTPADSARAKLAIGLHSPTGRSPYLRQCPAPAKESPQLRTPDLAAAIALRIASPATEIPSTAPLLLSKTFRPIEGHLPAEIAYTSQSKK